MFIVLDDQWFTSSMAPSEEKAVLMRIISRIGKLLFPHLPSDLRRRKVQTFCIAFFVSLVVIGLIVLLFWSISRPD